MKSLKTPLRYPGGKSRALANLFRFLPDLSQVTEYREPFLGGGSVALEVTKRYPKLNIWVNDLYEPLTNFWKTLQDDGYKMYKRLQELKSRYPDQGSAKGLFLEAKELVNDLTVSPLYRACSFYVINKCSFSGLSESSSFSRQASDSNFSMRGIERLPAYTQLIQNWKITNGRYQQLLTDDKSIFTYLDPPMRSDPIYMVSVETCTKDSIMTGLLLFVTALSVLNLYLIIRLNSYVRGSRGGQ